MKPVLLQYCPHRVRVWFLVLLASVLALSPRPARAFLGIGDISHDPLLMAGMFGQTGAQLAQLVQTYMLLVDMKNRYGSLTKLATWKKMLRNYATRSLQNLARQVVYDLERRGARISAQTPTNPILSTVITGRRKLREMEDDFNRADALSTSYSKSDWSIAKLDREQQLKEAQARRDAAADAASSDAPKAAGAIAANGAAYDSRPLPAGTPATGSGSSTTTTQKTNSDGSLSDSSAYSLYSPKIDEALATFKSGSVSGDGTSGTSTAPGAGSSQDSSTLVTNDGAKGTSAATIAKLTPLMQTTEAADSAESTKIDANVAGARDDLDTKYRFNDVLVTPKYNGLVATNFKYDGSAKSSALISQSVETTQAAVLQEHDSAVSFVDNATKILAESREGLDQAGAKGPEPFLGHMIAQNDTLIGTLQMQVRASRAAEEKAQAEKVQKEQRQGNGWYMNKGTHENALGAMKGSLSRP